MSRALQSVGSWLSGVAQPLAWAAVVCWSVIWGVSSALSFVERNDSRLTRLEQFQETAGASIRSIDNLSDSVSRLDKGQDEQAVLIRELIQQTARLVGQVEVLTNQVNANGRRR
jgi:TolA-binding protein